MESCGRGPDSGWSTPAARWHSSPGPWCAAAVHVSSGVIRVDFGMSGICPVTGNLGNPDPPVLPVEGIGLDVIQTPKPEPRIMRYELTDFEWATIRSFLPNKPRGIPRVDDRRVLNGIFWVLRSGAPWRDLPVSYGPRTTCYNRFVRWRQAGVCTHRTRSFRYRIKPVPLSGSSMGCVETSCSNRRPASWQHVQ
ncbi:MAG: transposase [Bradyrhizobium sp.]|nr:transposase [Bradyrhizobium sp.]